MLPICANRKETRMLTRATMNDEVADLLGGGCHAIVVDGDTVYNTYDKPATARERLAQEMTRSWMAINAHLVMHSVTVLEIYMFGEHPWMVRVDSGKVMSRWTSDEYDAAYTS